MHKVKYTALSIAAVFAVSTGAYAMGDCGGSNHKTASTKQHIAQQSTPANVDVKTTKPMKPTTTPKIQLSITPKTGG